MRTAFFLLFCLTASLAQAAQSRLSGVMGDEGGGGVSGASVSVVGSSGVEQQTLSGPDGRFSLPGAPGGGLTLVVRAGGFAEWSQPVTNREVDVVLKLASLFETVT